jgi:hypothetical protein
VVVDDFYIVGTVVGPAKEDPPLVVNSNAVLARPNSRNVGRTFEWSEGLDAAFVDGFDVSGLVGRAVISQ